MPLPNFYALVFYIVIPTIVAKCIILAIFTPFATHIILTNHFTTHATFFFSIRTGTMNRFKIDGLRYNCKNNITCKN